MSGIERQHGRNRPGGGRARRRVGGKAGELGQAGGGREGCGSRAKAAGPGAGGERANGRAREKERAGRPRLVSSGVSTQARPVSSYFFICDL